MKKLKFSIFWLCILAGITLNGQIDKPKELWIQLNSSDEFSGPKLCEIQVYPNPANEELNISVNGLAKGIVQLMDIRGVVLKEKQLENGQTTLQVYEIANGFYLIHFSNGTGFSYSK
tara:strand:+ start:610 stop:960 length:351 start_codon:yes stop_codon:yes gene_type:complete